MSRGTGGTSGRTGVETAAGAAGVIEVDLAGVVVAGMVVTVLGAVETGVVLVAGIVVAGAAAGSAAAGAVIFLGATAGVTGIASGGVPGAGRLAGREGTGALLLEVEPPPMLSFAFASTQ